MTGLIIAIIVGLVIIDVVIELTRDAMNGRDASMDAANSHRRLLQELDRHDH
jgi:L-cystine uptake protein TcyP (sodium:dicarboxylate symporter family)